MPIEIDESILRASFAKKEDALQFLHGVGGYQTYFDSHDKLWHFQLTPIGQKRWEEEQKKR